MAEAVDLDGGDGDATVVGVDQHAVAELLAAVRDKKVLRGGGGVAAAPIFTKGVFKRAVRVLQPKARFDTGAESVMGQVVTRILDSTLDTFHTTFNGGSAMRVPVNVLGLDAAVGRTLMVPTQLPWSEVEGAMSRAVMATGHRPVHIKAFLTRMARHTKINPSKVGEKAVHLPANLLRLFHDKMFAGGKRITVREYLMALMTFLVVRTALTVVDTMQEEKTHMVSLPLLGRSCSNMHGALNHAVFNDEYPTFSTTAAAPRPRKRARTAMT
jgi:hypothetical protein